MKKWIFSLVSITSLSAHAQLVPFSGGQTISANTMNDNFNFLKNKWPTSTGAAGDILISNGNGGSYWSPPAAGGGNGLSSVSINTTGYGYPQVSTSGSAATITLPMASSPTTTAGLISYSDYSNFITKPAAPNNNDLLYWNQGSSTWSSAGFNVTASSGGSSFGFSINGLTWNLNIPMASYPGVAAGLISTADYDKFNAKIGIPANSIPSDGQVLQFSSGSWVPMSMPTFIGQGGNSFVTAGVDQDVVIGSNNNTNLLLRTYGTERVRITPTGNVGIGTSNPTSKLQVETSAYNAAMDPIVKMQGMLNGTSFQKGFEFKLTGNQSGAGAYSAMLVNVDITNNGGTGSKKLLELSTSTVVSGTEYPNSQFAVNDKGYISTDGFMYKITTAPTSAASCLTAPPYTGGVSLTSASIASQNDFGAGVTYTVPTASEMIVQVILDLPAFTSTGTGTFMGVYGYLTNGMNTVEIKPGVNIKRLGAGTWNFGLGCMAASGSSMSATFSTGGIFSIRRFH